MAVYIAAVVDSAVGASKWHLGLMNAAGPKFVVEVVGVRVIGRMDVAVAGLAPSFTLRRMSGLGTGSAVVARKLNKLTPDVPAGVTALSNLSSPTAESNNELAAVVVSTEETQAAASAPSLWPPDGVDEPVFLNNGDGVAIQQAGLASVGDLDVYLYFRIARKP